MVKLGIILKRIFNKIIKGLTKKAKEEARKLLSEILGKEPRCTIIKALITSGKLLAIPTPILKNVVNFSNVVRKILGKESIHKICPDLKKML